MSPPATSSPPLCPSAQPEMEGVVVFGVVGGTASEPRVGYLTERLPVTPELLALTGEVRPAEVFRFGAPCAGKGCRHFDGSDCRWWRQEGKAACMRCPQVVTVNYVPSDEMRLAADPAA